ncbi:MAG: hypothetical protein ACRD35_09770 [Candidatus Acidiferrales bacterium]
MVGPLLAAEGARMVVREEACHCQPLEDGAADIVLLTVGTESEVEGEIHFHPLATLAFDRTLGQDDLGAWLAMWTYGPSPAGWRRHLRAFLPLPVGSPRASTSTLKRLDARLAAIRQGADEDDLIVPDPVVRADNLGRFALGHGVTGALRRSLTWANVFNPAQFIFRTYLLRRKDRGERNFQRAYLAAQWLVDLKFSGQEKADWVQTLREIRFHLLRNRSFYGAVLEHGDSLDLVHSYESSLRVKLGKTSSWLQSAANEHLLRYQPIYRYAANGATYPVGGVLYYDPHLGAIPDPGWWDVANPFDLPYNPHSHPEVQRLAHEHPDDLIPLAIYTYQTDLSLRPIIAVDFFAPSNPGRRESTHQMMLLAKQWLTITTGALDVERVPFRLIVWAANKKGFTPLVDKSSRLGTEELRLALEAGLYFDPEIRERLLRQADRRVLNPLVKAGPTEERLAHLQHESLRAQDDRALCQQVQRIREELLGQLNVARGLEPAAQRAELGRRLQAWRQERQLADFLSEPLGDFGSLASLEAPLRYFLENEPVHRERLAKRLAELYGKLYRQQLRLPEDREVKELSAALALTQTVWQKVLAENGEFERRRSEVEQKARQRYAESLKRREKKRVELLRAFLEDSHEQISRAAKTGCQSRAALPSELEAHLTILREVLHTAYAEPELRAAVGRRLPQLQRDLEHLQTALRRCPPEGDTWVADSRALCLELTETLYAELSAWGSPLKAGGGK